MRYLIHSCQNRKWYVDKYIVPSLISQGIPKDKICVFTDDKGLGNLEAFKKSIKLFGADDYWHLQDDILISSHFKDQTEILLSEDHPEVICGFACKACTNSAPGFNKPMNMWYSFPCIYISKKLIHEFIGWLDYKAATKVPDCFWVRDHRGDDALFRNFLIYYYPNMDIYNLAPNLVNHVDYLLGGSLANKQRDPKIDLTAEFWAEPELLTKLEEELGGNYVC